MEPVIDFEHIYVSYGLSSALRDINLKIYPNENWVILGANGSGKSTLMKLFSNDLYPNSAYPFKKEIFGKERHDIFELKNKLGIVTNDLQNKFETRSPQASALDVVLSGYHSALGVFAHHDFTEEQLTQATDAMKFLDIWDIRKKRVCEMSTGQLRRCIVGRSLIHKPGAFVLDEPTTGLDMVAKAAFVMTMQKLAHEVPVILITHDVSEIFKEITHAALMYKGTIAKKGPIKEILTSKNLSEIFGAKVDIECSDGKYILNDVRF